MFTLLKKLLFVPLLLAIGAAFLSLFVSPTIRLEGAIHGALIVFIWTGALSMIVAFSYAAMASWVAAQRA